MAARHQVLIIVFLSLLFLPSSSPAYGLPLGELGTLLSLSESLITRVANARAVRGDLAGADRARKIADHLRLLGRGSAGIWALAWDFVRNYAWRIGDLPAGELSRAAGDLAAVLSEVARARSAADRAAWARRNYARVLALANSLFRSLLKAFSRSGPLREAVVLLQREVTEGELLRDCLAVGSADLEGLLWIAKNLFSSAASGGGEL